MLGLLYWFKSLSTIDCPTFSTTVFDTSEISFVPEVPYSSATSPSYGTSVNLLVAWCNRVLSCHAPVTGFWFRYLNDNIWTCRWFSWNILELSFPIHVFNGFILQFSGCKSQLIHLFLRLQSVKIFKRPELYIARNFTRNSCMQERLLETLQGQTVPVPIHVELTWLV